MRTRTELVSRSGKQYTRNSIGSVLGSVFIGNEENVSPGVPDIHLKKVHCIHRLLFPVGPHIIYINIINCLTENRFVWPVKRKSEWNL